MQTFENHRDLVEKIADLLKQYDTEEPEYVTSKGTKYLRGIGPFAETPLIRELGERLTQNGFITEVKQHPDLVIQRHWGIEFKLARPFGNNGREDEHWSKNLTHPYKGSMSLIGDALTLTSMDLPRKFVFAIGYEHDPPKISLEPLFRSFELIAEQVMGLELGPRVEVTRAELVHPVHQILRCASWEVLASVDSNPFDVVRRSD